MLLRKILFISSVTLLFLIIPHPAYADVSAQLKEAEEYIKTGNHAEAEKIYQRIITANLGTSDGLRAQQKLTVLYVAWGKQTDAQVSLENLLTQYSQHELLPEAVTKVGDAYRKAENYTKAAELHRYVVERWPNNEFAFWSQMDLVMCSEALRDVVGAQAAFEKLSTQYSGHQLMPKAICFLGDDYRRRGQHARALELYGQVLSNWPKAEDAFWSQMGLAISNLGLGDYSTAQDAINKLRATFSEDKRIPTAACLIGDAYRGLNKYKEAVELYKYVVDNRPDAEYALWSRMGLAISYLSLGNETAASEAVDKLRTDFAADKRIPIALCLTADEFRKAGKHEKACELYRYVVEKWPDAEHAMWSQMGLAISSLRLGDYEIAASAVNKLRADFSKDERMPMAACMVADEYRRLSKHDKACELYQYVVSSWPNAEYTIWSQANLIKSYLALGDDTAAEAAVSKLLGGFSGSNNKAKAIHDTAYEFRKLEKYEMANKLDQYVIGNWPDNEQAIWAKLDMARLEVILGNHVAVQSAIDNLISNFSAHPSLSSAIFQIGEQYYNKAFQMQNDGLEDEARDNFGKAVSVWERIITQMPSSDFAPHAYYFSGYCYSRLGEYEIAKEYYQMVVNNWPDFEHAREAMFMIEHRAKDLQGSYHSEP